MTSYHPAEYHAFEASGHRFLYLVPSAAIFEPSPLAHSILDRLAAADQTREEILTAFGPDAEEAWTSSTRPAPSPPATASTTRWRRRHFRSRSAPWS